MKIKDFYRRAINVGKEHDPRPKAELERILKQRKKEFDSLSEENKAYFDTERLENPYSDTRIFFGDENVSVKNIMVGIDISGEELLVADRLREKGEKIDLVVGHHPPGLVANFRDVMWLQTDQCAAFGIPINVAEGLFQGRADEIDRRFLPRNHHKATDLARLLDIPLMGIHTPADNCVADYLQNKMTKKKPKTVEEVLKILEEEPEYQAAKKEDTGMRLVAGSPGNRTGEVLIEMTGGTEGPKELIAKIASNTKIGTIVGMHMSEEMLKEAKQHHINVIIAGHMASDNIGMNILLDGVMGKEKIKVIECSSFRRVKRS